MQMQSAYFFPRESAMRATADDVIHPPLRSRERRLLQIILIEFDPLHLLLPLEFMKKIIAITPIAAAAAAIHLLSSASYFHISITAQIGRSNGST